MTKKNKKKTDVKIERASNKVFAEMGSYIKKRYPFLLVLLLEILMVSLIYFAKVSTVETVAGFNLDNYEIGQISDRTIIADRTLYPDSTDPVMIQKGEKIIKNGFPITEENYAKLKKMSASPKYIDYRSFANGELAIIILSIPIAKPMPGVGLPPISSIRPS